MRPAVRLTALAVAVAALAVGCSSNDDGGEDATRAMVLATCSPGGDPVETAVCECAYDRLRERFDTDELRRLDARLRDGAEDVPDEVQAIVLECGFEPVAPPTTKPTTTSSSTSTSLSPEEQEEQGTTTTRRSP